LVECHILSLAFHLVCVRRKNPRKKLEESCKGKKVTLPALELKQKTKDLQQERRISEVNTATARNNSLFCSFSSFVVLLISDLLLFPLSLWDLFEASWSINLISTGDTLLDPLVLIFGDACGGDQSSSNSFINCDCLSFSDILGLCPCPLSKVLDLLLFLHAHLRDSGYSYLSMEQQ
jgi:hypothetical protein